MKKSVYIICVLLLPAFHSCTPEIEKVWEYDSGGWISGYAPVVYQGRVYGVNLEGKIFCVDDKSGKEIWATETGYFINSGPTAYDGKIYLGEFWYLPEGAPPPYTTKPRILCLDAATGKIVWKYDMEMGMETTPAIYEDKVYVAGWDNKFRCLDAQDGKLIWEYELGVLVPGISGMESSPMIAQGKVYVGGFDGRLYCFDAGSGEKLWDFIAGVSPVASSPVVHQNKVFVGNYHGILYALDSTTGTKLWEYDNDFHPIFAAPAVYEGKVYGISYLEGEPFTQGPVKIFCLDCESGELIWENYFGWGGHYPEEVPAAFSIHASPTIAHGKVFIGSWNGKVYCFDAAHGSQLWEYVTGDDTSCVCPILFSGKMLIGTNTGKLYCLDTKDPLVDGWLVFNHDLEHSGDATGWGVKGSFVQSLSVGTNKNQSFEILSGTISCGGYSFNIGADFQGRWLWTTEDQELQGFVSDLTRYIVQETKDAFPSYELDDDLVVVVNELKAEMKGSRISNGTLAIGVEGTITDHEGHTQELSYSFNGRFAGSM